MSCPPWPTSGLLVLIFGEAYYYIKTIMTGLADDWLADLNDLSDAQDEQEPFNPSYSLMYIACRAPLNSNNPRTQNG